MVKKIDYKKQGKKNRAAGRRFETKVRKDLEDKGFICSKWQNTIKEGKCVPAKPGKFRMMQTGFPDFICFKTIDRVKANVWEGEEPNIVYFPFGNYYEVIGVEVKSNGYMSKEEKEKAIFYLNNNYCSKFLIASKGEKRGTIKYTEFKTTN